jgi:hypothetical protein
MGLYPHAHVAEVAKAVGEHRAMHALENDISLFK